MKPTVKTKRKNIIDQKPKIPISLNATAHGNRNIISRSKIINKMATK
jgi:hypothetical protein